MVYDSLYAYQDTEDDKKVGVKSTALLWGKDYKKFCAFFTAGAASMWGLGGYLAELGPGFYPCITVAIFHMVYQWKTININDPEDCWNKFSANQLTGCIIFSSFIIGRLTQTKKQEKSLKNV